MNHTIKGIIIVVAITSMLVVGAASMIPIMQNSFAYKKSDFKQADRDPNTNTNTATSDSQLLVTQILLQQHLHHQYQYLAVLQVLSMMSLL
ncbi:MAG: hypothetical protein JO297_04075 [Nitrososphaeraceae archaeon]|nr:hypothetical protein [Nitrososphaeraceae archaeon]